MTQPHLPQTVNRAVVVAVAVAVFGLALHQPVVVLGGLSGILLGIGVAGLSGTPERITVAAAAFPVGLVTLTGVVVGVGAGVTALPGVSEGPAVSFWGVVATLVAGLLGLLLVATLTGEVTERNLSNAGVSTFTGTLFGGVFAGLAYWATQQDSLGSLALSLGPGLRGFALTAGVAAVAVVVAVVAIPNAALASPGRRDHLAYRRRQFVVAVFVLTGTIVAILSVVDLAGGSTAVDSLSRSAVVRGILVSLAGLGLFVATLGRMAAVSWRRNDSSENPIVAVLLGTALGVCLPIIAGLVAGVSPELLFLVPGLFALAGLGLLLLWWVYGLVEPARSFRETLPTLLSALCVVGTLAVGVDIGDSLALGLSGVGATLTFAAGLFIYSVGRYGTTLADEIPTGEVERMPQLVQIAYAGGVVALGGVLAIGGFALAMGLSPQFSFAALIGLVAAFLALIALVTVLRSRDGTPVS